MARKRAKVGGMVAMLLVAGACAADIVTLDAADKTPLRDGTLHMEAAATGDGAVISVSAVVENRRDEGMSFSPDYGCDGKSPLLVGLYRPDAPTRVWWGRGTAQPTGPNSGCIARGWFLHLDPGQRAHY